MWRRRGGRGRTERKALGRLVQRLLPGQPRQPRVEAAGARPAARAAPRPRRRRAGPDGGAAARRDRGGRAADAAPPAGRRRRRHRRPSGAAAEHVCRGAGCNGGDGKARARGWLALGCRQLRRRRRAELFEGAVRSGLAGGCKSGLCTPAERASRSLPRRLCRGVLAAARWVLRSKFSLSSCPRRGSARAHSPLPPHACPATTHNNTSTPASSLCATAAAAAAFRARARRAQGQHKRSALPRACSASSSSSSPALAGAPRLHALPAHRLSRTRAAARSMARRAGSEVRRRACALRRRPPPLAHRTVARRTPAVPPLARCTAARRTVAAAAGPRCAAARRTRAAPHLGRRCR